MNRNERKMRSASWIGIAASFLAAAGSIGICRAQSMKAQDIRHGQTIYRIYCAVCHGDAGHGDGPMSTIIKVQVPDLTQIAKRNNGVFSLQSVEKRIDGTGSEGRGHGTREMPIWGAFFGQTGLNRERGRIRIHDVAKYLQSLQRDTR